MKKLYVEMTDTEYEEYRKMKSEKELCEQRVEGMRNRLTEKSREHEELAQSIVAAIEFDLDRVIIKDPGKARLLLSNAFFILEEKMKNGN